MSKASKAKQRRRKLSRQKRQARLQSTTPHFEQVQPEGLEWLDESEKAAAWPFDSPAPIQCLVDTTRQWSAQVWRCAGADGTQLAGSLRVGIRAARAPATTDNPRPASAEIRATWSQMQAIKDAHWPHRLAVEIYPPRHAIVDAAPMRWLWILPAGAALPFNLQAEGIGPAAASGDDAPP